MLYKLCGTLTCARVVWDFHLCLVRTEDHSVSATEFWFLLAGDMVTQDRQQSHVLFTPGLPQSVQLSHARCPCC